MSGRNPRSNALGWALIAVPAMVLLYALLGYAAVELVQFLVEHDTPQIGRTR